ncbi:hypothetical protein CIK05_07130 [Bdellovibrio sp. qaytius]|nr:hypothetical protein CIK05_07130 [Bdellovibrio sp. qaytius]
MSLKIQIILMSYNRPEFILEAIKSIQNQTYKNIEFVVSDNSSNNVVFDLIQKSAPEVKIVKRGSNFSMSQHWNQILSEVSSSGHADYFMMFHDDDIMLPNCIADLVTLIEQNPTVSAVAGNAYVIRQTSLTDDIFNSRLKENLLIKNVEELGLRYFEAGAGVNPFPGYLYSKKVAQTFKFNNKEAGKHSDVTFLFKALTLGPIAWAAKPTMNYRIHGSNDSVGVDMLALLGLVKIYLRSAKSANAIYHAKEFTFKNYLLWLKEQNIKKMYKAHPQRVKTIIWSATKFFSQNPSGMMKYCLRKFGMADAN